MSPPGGAPNPGSWQPSSAYNYQQSVEYNAPQSACPPGCTCQYDKSQQNYTSYSTSPPAPEDRMDLNWGGNGADYQPRKVSPPADSHIIKNPANPQPDESGKFPFHVIIQEIIRGLAGDQYAAATNTSLFRTKLDVSETQRMSGLFFFNSFTQRDVNLQCTLLLQVIQYWSLEDTIPDFSAQAEQEDDHSGKSRSRSPKSPRSPREASTKRKSRRGPPVPRYWSRMENAAVVGLMCGLPLDLLKVVLERRTSLSLGAVDAILDTNSAEALELLRSGTVNYTRGYSISNQYHAQNPPVSSQSIDSYQP
ncbi:hypothetical protein EV426DRAFT_574591 [Tirmania nivea]|nr:hypothetical protein EV426DRAFT_574591 [Tirmania nivea]